MVTLGFGKAWGRSIYIPLPFIGSIVRKLSFAGELLWLRSLTLPSPARGEGFLIPLPRREGLGEGDLNPKLDLFHHSYLAANCFKSSSASVLDTG